MAESEEALQLKRRARRRLIGAIALVTFAVIILPLVLDKEPGPAGLPLSVQIPDQGSSGLSSRVVPSLPVAPVEPQPEKKAGSAPVHSALPQVKSTHSGTAASAKPKAGPATVGAAAKAPSKAEEKAEELRAEAALNDLSWAVALDAFSDQRNVKQLRAKLSAAGVKSYAEPIKTSKGELTRVRAGPFASKEAAEKVRAKLSSMGLKPGAVTRR